MPYNTNKTNLIIIGAGGHARSVLDIALQNGTYQIAGCIDPCYPQIRSVPLMNEVPVIGNDDDLPEFFLKGFRHIFIAIGSNHLRKKLYENAIQIGYEPVNIISRHAVISPRAVLGKGICIMPGAVININAFIGDNCIINTRCCIDHDCNIGNNCHIAPGVSMSGTVKVGEGVHIGTGASVIEDLTIEPWSYIGCGSAVVKNISGGMLAYGVPAREIKKF